MKKRLVDLAATLEAYCRYGPPDFYVQLDLAEQIEAMQIEAARAGIDPGPVAAMPTPIEGLATIGRILAAIQPHGRFLTIEDSAGYTGLSPESIRRMISAGKLTPLRPVRGRVVLCRLQLDSVVLSATSNPRKGRGFKVKSK